MTEPRVLDTVDLEDEYRAARRAAGKAYEHANPSGYAAICSAVMREYTGATGQYAKLMQTVQLQCAKAANFPGFKEWCAAHPEPLTTEVER